MGLRGLTIICQGAFWSNRVWTLEDPVLPRGQAAVDLRIHRLWTSEAERRFHSGQRVRRQRRAFFDRDANFVFPIEIVGSKSDETELFRCFRIEQLRRVFPARQGSATEAASSRCSSAAPPRSSQKQRSMHRNPSTYNCDQTRGEVLIDCLRSNCPVRRSRRSSWR